MTDPRTVNAAAWDRLARAGASFARVATDAELADPLGTLDPRGWLPRDLAGRAVLCLAAGGGWQSTLFAAAGADVTVVDISDGMLARDRREASRHGFAVRCVRASMDDLAGLADEAFDVVHQPVSSCYVPDVSAVFRGVARVLRPGGLYVSQHKQPLSLRAASATERGYVIDVSGDRPSGDALPPPSRSLPPGYREAGTAEYAHSLEALIGGLCRAGFVVEDLSEPAKPDRKAAPGTAGHRDRFIPPYVRLKARRAAAATAEENARLWTP
ncbi:MAG: class I SAM-dependent methyltransferase [Planctomycetota bacterium]